MVLVLAIVAAGLAVLLTMPADRSVRLHRWCGLPTVAPSGRWPRLGPPAALIGVLAIAAPLLRPAPHRMLVVATVAGAAWAALLLVRRGQCRSLRALRRHQVVDICDALVAELRAGQPPARALAWAAHGWPELDRASAVAGLGGDVPAAMRRVASRPGAEPFAQIAAGWEVAQRSGAGLVDVLDRLSRSLRDDDDVRREISASLGPTRATGRLLAGLPVFGLGLGYAMGADPVAVLLGSTLGSVCLALGVSLAVTGLFWVEHIADRAEP